MRVLAKVLIVKEGSEESQTRRLEGEVGGKGSLEGMRREKPHPPHTIQLSPGSQALPRQEIKEKECRPEE